MQELIAPYEVDFFDKGWSQRGKKRDMVEILSAIMNIDKATLLDADNLPNVLIAHVGYPGPHTVKPRELKIELTGCWAYSTSICFIYTENGKRLSFVCKKSLFKARQTIYPSSHRAARGTVFGLKTFSLLHRYYFKIEAKWSGYPIPPSRRQELSDQHGR